MKAIGGVAILFAMLAGCDSGPAPDVKVLAGGVSCEVDAHTIPCKDSGAYLRDTLHVSSHKPVSVVVYDDVATKDEARVAGDAVRGAGYADVKYFRVGFITEPGQKPGGS